MYKTRRVARRPDESGTRLTVLKVKAQQTLH